MSDAALPLDAILQPVVESGTPPTRDQIARIEALLDRLERASTTRDDTPPVGSSDAPAAFEDEEARRVFVVDSDAGRARTWSVELAQFGYAIELYSSVDAVDAVAAVDGIVAGRRPSAIIVDMTLPNGRLANAETVAPLAFAMLDIGHFKSFNDTYGHPTGDRVLKSLAQVLMRSLRKIDVIGRYGGEEFGVVLVNTAGARAKTIIDEIRANFANLRNRANGKQFSVTFSGGVAEFPLCGDDTTLNETADKALYEATNGGRNRVVPADAITA